MAICTVVKNVEMMVNLMFWQENIVHFRMQFDSMVQNSTSSFLGYYLKTI